MKRKRCCRVPGCCRKDVYAFGYCERHYKQYKTHGKILERTLRDPNEIIDYGEYVGVCLYNRKHEKIAEALVDKQDVQIVKQHKWRRSCKGYAITASKKSGKDTTIFMHNFLFPVTVMTDHVNRNKLDNRRVNLRECTNSENQMNILLRKDTSSGVMGVNRSNSGKWVSRIQYNKKRLVLGYFDDFNEAVKVRREAEKKYYKEFAPNI